MNTKKFPESDPLFYAKVKGACQTEFQRGLVFILIHTGMHISCAMGLVEDQMDVKGDVYWRRVRTMRQMRARIPEGDRSIVSSWIERFGENRRTTRWARMAIKQVGVRAGFPDLSPMSFRVQRAITLLDEGMSPHEVKHVLGCSLDVLEDNYTQLKTDRRADGDDDRLSPDQGGGCGGGCI